METVEISTNHLTSSLSPQSVLGATQCQVNLLMNFQSLCEEWGGRERCVHLLQHLAVPMPYVQKVKTHSP